MPPIGMAFLPQKRHSDLYRSVHDSATWQEAWNQYLGTRVTHDPSLGHLKATRISEKMFSVHSLEEEPIVNFESNDSIMNEVFSRHN